MFKYKFKYCVAQVNFIDGRPEVGFYACANDIYKLDNDSYKLYIAFDWNDKKYYLVRYRRRGSIRTV